MRDVRKCKFCGQVFYVPYKINGVKDDNEVGNLQLMTRKEHSRLHREQELKNGKGLFGEVI